MSVDGVESGRWRCFFFFSCFASSLLLFGSVFTWILHFHRLLSRLPSVGIERTRWRLLEGKVGCLMPMIALFLLSLAILVAADENPTDLDAVVTVSTEERSEADDEVEAAVAELR